MLLGSRGLRPRSLPVARGACSEVDDCHLSGFVEVETDCLGQQSDPKVMTDDEQELHDAAIGQVLPEGGDLCLRSPAGAGHLIGEADHSSLAGSEGPIHRILVPVFAGGGEQRDLFAGCTDACSDRSVLQSLVLAADRAGNLQDRAVVGRVRVWPGSPRQEQARGRTAWELDRPFGTRAGQAGRRVASGPLGVRASGRRRGSAPSFTSIPVSIEYWPVCYLG